MLTVDLNGHPVPALGFGTWQLEGEDCYEAVRDAVELGYRHIDTAQMYGNEAEVGQALAESGVDRHEIFLTTKIWMEDLPRDRFLDAAGASLDKLRTDHVDLMLIHWPDPDVPLDEPIAALRQLQEEKRVRHIGVSNFTPTLLDLADAKGPVECLQVEYHPFLGQDHLLREVRARGMMLTAYCPLARGEVMDNQTLRSIGEAHGKSAAQVTLRWLVQQDSVSAIPKAADREHRRSNLEIFDFELSDDEMERIFALDRGQRLIDPDHAPEWER